MTSFCGGGTGRHCHPNTVNEGQPARTEKWTERSQITTGLLGPNETFGFYSKKEWKVIRCS